MFHRCKNESEGKTLYRKLAKVLHPDLGGSDDLMVLLKETYDSFTEQLMEFRRRQEAEKSYYEYCSDQKKSNAKTYASAKKQESRSRKDWPGKYQEVDSSLDIEEEEDVKKCKIFDEVFTYAKEHPSFDQTFVVSVFSNFCSKGSISAKAYNAVVKIYYTFHMHEWLNINSGTSK
jgi:curved DNA-binding protein CbpA